jgi:hypothetical protein
LALCWDLRDDLFDIRQESHITHAICLIKDEVLDPLQVDRATTHVIEKTSRARHDDLRLTAQIRYLATVRDTTINGYALDTCSGSESFDDVVNLLR